MSLSQQGYHGPKHIKFKFKVATLATLYLKFGHLAKEFGILVINRKFVRPFSGDMASKLTRRKKKKEPPDDVGVNLSVECVKISQEKNTKKEPPNDVDVKKMHQQQDVDKMEKSKNQKKITALKLVNNRTFNNEETRNLCFVNATIQILHSIPDIRTYFKTVDYVDSDPNSFTVSKELTRIFKNGGKSSVSAAKLRKLIGQSSGRNDISDGSQQDFMDFHSLLLKVLWDELLMKGDVYGLSLIHQFYGKEKNEKKFIHTQKASCSQGHSTRTEEEDFQTIKLAVPVSSRGGC